MAKVVVYKDDGEVVDIAKNVNDIIVNGGDVKWSTGGFTGIKHSFKFYDDTCLIDIGENIDWYSDKEITLNTKSEEEKLQDQIANMQKVINDMLLG
jgi:hypothetical protein